MKSPLQKRNRWSFLGTTIRALCAVALTTSMGTVARAQLPQNYLFNDSHFHLTNYICEGTDIHKYMEIMGDKVGRSTLFGIPLQQMWNYNNTRDFAPYYYTQADDPLYYYSFTDAYIAMAYKSLTPKEQARLDPMITGFNPADMYAADHIKRVLRTFPGVFTGIGEFSIHKEFVSSKTAGGVATLDNRALDRIFDTCAEVGLVAILHCDADSPYPRAEQPPYILEQLGALFRRHPNTTIIWAHMGLGRVVRPVKGQLAIVEKAMSGPDLKHVYIDISWDEVAKYVVASPETVKATADFINKFPDRVLFGSDCVAPKSIDNQMAVYNMYKPLWDALKPDVREKVLKGNYERLFNEARVKVRAWEKANAAKPEPPGQTTPSSGLLQ
jgi:predicted TIM-barrel fold metal-dependent hydrolase